MRVLVLGAGFGGLELSTRLSDEFGEVLDIVLIDKNEGFVFGFSKLDVMFGRKNPSEVFHSYGDLEKPGLRFVQTTIRSIDPVTEHVETDSGAFDADFALRDELSAFDGGHVVVGVTSTPFKCPPAPSETARLMHDFLVERGIRGNSSISLVMPLGVPIPPFTGGLGSPPRGLCRAGYQLASRTPGEGLGSQTESCQFQRWNGDAL
jgi:sulfide:quinone oxidoreductase